MSFRWETSGGIAKCWLFSQSNVTAVSGAVYLFECRGVEEVGNTVKAFEAVLPNLTQYLLELTVQLINVFST